MKSNENYNIDELLQSNDPSFLVFCHYSEYFEYNRDPCKDQIALQNRICELYNGVECLVMPSGMSAITGVFHSLLKIKEMNYIVVHGNELFSGTKSSLDFFQEFYGIKTISIDVTNKDDCIKTADSLKKKNVILYIESCSNPNGYMLDPEVIAIFKKNCLNCTCIVDDTWTTCFSFNPFDYGADLVASSLTKYFSAGKAIGGFVVSKNLLLSSLKLWFSSNGLHVSPYNTHVFLHALESIEERLNKGSLLAADVINSISSHPMIHKISHPSVKSHPSFHIGEKLLKLNPSIIGLYIKTTKSTEEVKEAIKSTDINLITSYGSRKSSIDNWTIKKSTVEKNEEVVFIRLYVGYEDTCDKIKNSLEQLIEKVK